MMNGNLASSLRRRARARCPLAAHDRLPEPARQWAAHAALPWSASSVSRLWTRALRETGGCAEQARARLDAAERRSLMRDAPQVWGADYPAPAASSSRKYPRG